MTCGCPPSPELLPEDMELPPDYNLYAERFAVMWLMRQLHAYRAQVEFIMDQISSANSLKPISEERDPRVDLFFEGGMKNEDYPTD